jgi:hypothetical protein
MHYNFGRPLRGNIITGKGLHAVLVNQLRKALTSCETVHLDDARIAAVAAALGAQFEKVGLSLVQTVDPRELAGAAGDAGRPR